MKIRFDWNLEELRTLYNSPLLELISQAHKIFIQYHPPGEVQVCSLLSIKTGGCPEDCKYCSQSSRYQTDVKAQAMLSFEEVMHEARKAVALGATRFCMGAAWREVRDNRQFEEVLRMVSGVASLGIEVCCTLGMLNEHQARRLKEAGLYAYNHNLDTSERFYPTIITTRSYQDRLKTLDIVEKAGLSVCCGGILGMGEEIEDRLELIAALCRRNPHPESVPINQLAHIPGTPLANQPKISVWEMIRTIAVARIAMPKAMVRLSCGRIGMSYESQALCFLAGANSIFMGEKLLTISNNPVDIDEGLIQVLGLKKRPAYA